MSRFLDREARGHSFRDEESRGCEDAISSDSELSETDSPISMRAHVSDPNKTGKKAPLVLR